MYCIIPFYIILYFVTYIKNPRKYGSIAYMRQMGFISFTVVAFQSGGFGGSNIYRSWGAGKEGRVLKSPKPISGPPRGIPIEFDDRP